MARAQLLDTPEESEEVTQETQEPQEVLEEIQEESQETTVEDELPDKYRGKSVKELVEMHQNAEQALGKQSSEVGELRKVVDDYISSQLSTQEAPVEEHQEDVDFFVDPEKAVAKAIENHPKIKEAEQYNQQYKKQTALAQLQQKHPDMEKILKNEEFAGWIKASKIRTDLFVRADQMYDYDAADELFSYWKERQGIVQQTVQLEKQARKQQVKAASTGKAQGNSQPTRKKIYRRSDIIKLMRDDPERYATLADEIMQAYREKRVR